jgi:hypothetical protein
MEKAWFAAERVTPKGWWEDVKRTCDTFDRHQVLLIGGDLRGQERLNGDLFWFSSTGRTKEHNPSEKAGRHPTGNRTHT